MNTKRILFWLGFLVVLGLIIWGLVAAQKKQGNAPGIYGDPAPVTAADHVKGPDSAKVTLIEYGDFQCPACAAYAPIVERLMAEEATGTLRIVFRYFPLPQHQNAIVAASAAEASGDQGKFWEMYDLLYKNQADWENDSNADAAKVFQGYAATLGLNSARFASVMNASSTAQKITDGRDVAEALQLNYTPTFYVNGKVVTNPQGYDAFKAVIDKAAQ